MRIAISNIAWDVAEDTEIVRLLHAYDVDAIDIAPGKYFPEPHNARISDILAVKEWWADQGIDIYGMQALLFGTTGLNVFGDSHAQQALLEHLAAVCSIGAHLGASKLVFGSPKNRDRTGFSDAQAHDVAMQFFSTLGNIASDAGVVICLEPNPTCYGANFMVNSADTAYVVQALSHPAIRMQLDAGAMTINEENIDTIVAQYAHIVGHVHASEPNLLPLGDRHTPHNILSLSLQQHLPQAVVSIEMLATRDEPHLSSVERSLKTAINHYRNDCGTSNGLAP